uniref:RAB interacting factor n=1 Tax=Astyanax mexicanus TaxID=7994 RepID=A0A3B1JQT2_ASTMX
MNASNRSECHEGSAEQSSLVSEDGKNIKSVVCQRCGSKVLCAGTAVLTEKELFLPSMRKKNNINQSDGTLDGDTLTNVGFTKDVGKVKYLICADCEIGPIGWHSLDDKKSFYVALDRVNHE